MGGSCCRHLGGDITPSASLSNNGQKGATVVKQPKGFAQPKL